MRRLLAVLITQFILVILLVTVATNPLNHVIGVMENTRKDEYFCDSIQPTPSDRISISNLSEHAHEIPRENFNVGGYSSGLVLLKFLGPTSARVKHCDYTSCLAGFKPSRMTNFAEVAWWS